jgi:hypothetical protein
MVDPIEWSIDVAVKVGWFDQTGTLRSIDVVIHEAIGRMRIFGCHSLNRVAISGRIRRADDLKGSPVVEKSLLLYA